jgi:two-component system phosphate regulon sensor histidine kinase PhoR
VKLQGKIVGTLMLLTVGSTIIVGLLAAWQINNFLEARAEKTLVSQVEMLSSLFVNGMLGSAVVAGRQHELRDIANRLGIRVTIIQKDGLVLFDSDVPRDSIRTMENHAGRPEVIKARVGTIGTDKRRSATLGVDFLYAAQMLADTSLGALDSSFVRGALPLYEIKEVNAQILTLVMSVVLVSALIIAAVGLYLSKRFSRPLLGIVETARAVTRGEVEKRIDYSSRDEIGELAQAINNMAEKLANDIAKLKKLERVRSEFLANVSHELRTPIFALQGFIETLLDGAVDDASVNREFLQKAHRQGERLNTLLSDLIEIARIESGEMKMSFRYFSLTDFLQQVVDEMRAPASKKDISIRLITTVADKTTVFGDRERLKQVMINLIDNAVKYTESGGAITCRAAVQNGHCLLSVEDTGCGIAHEHLSRIFERFYRVDRDRSREVGGTGLGLAIVKHIVEAHDSSVQVSSQLGKGSAFSFRLKT